jgi:hypothetical protein
MRLAKKTPMEEPLYECDDCRWVGQGRFAIIFEESGKQLCFSCWYEKDRRRPRLEKSTLIEI